VSPRQGIVLDIIFSALHNLHVISKFLLSHKFHHLGRKEIKRKMNQEFSFLEFLKNLGEYLILPKFVRVSEHTPYKRSSTSNISAIYSRAGAEAVRSHLEQFQEGTDGDLGLPATYYGSDVSKIVRGLSEEDHRLIHGSQIGVVTKKRCYFCKKCQVKTWCLKCGVAVCGPNPVANPPTDELSLEFCKGIERSCFDKLHAHKHKTHGAEEVLQARKELNIIARNLNLEWNTPTEGNPGIKNASHQVKRKNLKRKRVTI
jgi:hypothetical protein